MQDIIFVICTYNQNGNLATVYESLRASYEGLSEENCYIINNHSNFVQPGPATVFHNTMRPDWSTGYLSRSWNQGLLWGFQSTARPKARWVCLVQADLIFLPGWHAEFKKAVAERNLEFVGCGPGDQATFISIEAFRSIGWWDERFCSIGFQEFDYFLRSLSSSWAKGSTSRACGRLHLELARFEYNRTRAG